MPPAAARSRPAAVLGKANRYTEIFENNKDVLKNPDLIHPGQVLKIPNK